MGTYVYRIAEMAELLAQVPEAANETIDRNFVSLLNEYSTLRENLLNDLVDVMAKASPTNLTRPKWESRIKDFRSEYRSLFARAARDFKLPQAHQVYWATALDTEEKFFETLSNILTAQRMDDLLQHQDNLSTLFRTLQDGWTDILTQNDYVFTQQRHALQDLDQMVQHIISDIDSSWGKVLEQSQRMIDAIRKEADNFRTFARQTLGSGADVVYEAVKKYLLNEEIKPDGTPDEIDDPAKATLEYYMLMHEASAEGARKRREALNVYRDLLSRQKGGVLTMFNSTRQQVDQYLRYHDLSEAQRFLDEAKAALEQWISGLPSSRQKDDAERFRANIVPKLDMVFKRTEEINNQFRTTFQGSLLLPISTETVENLAQRYAVREQLDRINGRDLTRRLDDIQRTLPEQAGRIDESLRNMVDYMCNADGITPDVRDLILTQAKGFQEYLHERIRTRIETLLPVIDDLKKSMIPSTLNEDFNRQELESMLN